MCPRTGPKPAGHLKGLAFTAALLVAGGAGAAEVDVLFVGEAGDAYRGFLQALEEANRQGRFLDFAFDHERVTFTELAGGGEPGAVHAALAAAAGDAPAIFTALDAARFVTVAEALADRPVFNLASRDDSLRRRCLDNAFHAAPSEQMLADAVAQWREAGNDDDGVIATVWNTDFRRYAASQLSKRFEAGQGAPMSDLAYAGWAGTRLYAQVVMARQSAAPAVMLEALRTDVAFDGQKGVPMQFRASGQLNQMILLEKDGEVVGQAPVRGVHGSHELETLGFSGCKE